DLIEKDKLKLNHKQTIMEFRTFSQNKLSWAAEDGFHDDLVMSLVIFAWLTTQQKFADFIDRDEMRLASEVFSRELEDMNEEYNPVVFVDAGDNSFEYSPLNHGISFV